MQNFINGITEKLSALKDKVKSMADTIKSYLHFSEPDVGPLSDFHTYAPDMMNLFMQGIRDNENALRKTVSNAFDFEDSFVSPKYDVSKLSQTKKVESYNNPDEYSRGTTISDDTPINLYIVNEVDGKRLNENSYTYTLGRMKRETNAVRIAHGGA